MPPTLTAARARTIGDDALAAAAAFRDGRVGGVVSPCASRRARAEATGAAVVAASSLDCSSGRGSSTGSDVAQGVQSSGVSAAALDDLVGSFPDSDVGSVGSTGKA
jgi:hypothetical protein